MNLVRWNDQTWLPVEELGSLRGIVELNAKTHTMHDERLYATVADASELLQKACLNGATHAEAMLSEIRAACVRLDTATKPRRHNAEWDRLLMDA